MKKVIMSVLTVWILVSVSLFSLIILSPKIKVQVSGATIIVDDDGTPGVDCNYTTIQEGIDAASPGDTVFVRNGTYYENVVVNKTINLTGKDRDITIINGSGSGIVVRIEADWVNITGFTLINGRYGIRVTSSYNNITNNYISGNGDISFSGIGIYLSSSDNNTISDNIITHTIPNTMMMEGWAGIYLFSSSNNSIINNNLSNNGQPFFPVGYGMNLEYSSNNTLINNTISWNHGDGVRITHSNTNLILGNNISNNRDGVDFHESSDINFSYNNISDNELGFSFYGSFNITITNNNFFHDDILISGNVPNHYNSHTIPTNNMVNDNPLYYYINSNNIDIDGDSMKVGELILVNCANITIKNLNINHTDVGIEIAYSINTTIMDCRIYSNEEYGIYLYSSSNINITGSNISNNSGPYCTYVILSSYCNIIDNTISNNNNGIKFDASTNNSIINNTVTGNNNGIRMELSSYNRILGNNASMNTLTGIHIEGGSSYNLVKNNMVLNNEDGILINANTPRNNTIENNNLSWNNDLGILLQNSIDSCIKNNIMESNTNYGIRLSFSDDCIISGNTVINNRGP